jgi:chaperonin cofactor prefoldin
MVFRVLVTVAAVLGASIATTAVAQVQRSGGSSGAANAQLMMQYQQASTERAQLQADNSKLKKDLDDLKKQLDAASKQVTASKAGVSRDAAQLAAVQAANDRGSKELADTKSKMQELIGKFRETLTQMRGIETERAQLQQQLAQSKTAFDQCADRNYSLYQVDSEVLDRYAHQGPFSYLERAEPFTRIKRAEIDNLVLEYKERAEELRVKKTGAAGVAPVAGLVPAGAVALGVSAPQGVAPAQEPVAHPGAGTNPPPAGPAESAPATAAPPQNH